jgi:hypothetical protein
MSPLALPRHILDRKINQLVKQLPAGALQDLLLQLKSRPTFQEQWPDQWRDGLVKGKQRVLKLEHIRKDRYTLGDILSEDSEIKQWWDDVKTN